MDLPDAEIELKKAYQVLGAHLKQPSEPIISINMPRCSLDSKPIENKQRRAATMFDNKKNETSLRLKLNELRIRKSISMAGCSKDNYECIGYKRRLQEIKLCQ